MEKAFTKGLIKLYKNSNTIYSSVSIDGIIFLLTPSILENNRYAISLYNNNYNVLGWVDFEDVEKNSRENTIENLREDFL